VPLLSDLLTRFRRTWAPAARLGANPAVPEDRPSELSEEARPLFHDLDALAREADAVRAAARAECDRVLANAQAQAAAVRADAEARLPRERAAAAAAQAQDIERTAAAELEEARVKAERTLAEGHRRLPATVDALVGNLFTAIQSAKGDVSSVGRR